MVHYGVVRDFIRYPGESSNLGLHMSSPYVKKENISRTFFACALTSVINRGMIRFFLRLLAPARPRGSA